MSSPFFRLVPFLPHVYYFRYRPCIVNGFHRESIRGKDGTVVKSSVPTPAEACKQIKPGNQLLAVNGRSVIGMEFADILAAIREGIVNPQPQPNGNGSVVGRLVLRFRSSMDRLNAQMTHKA